MANAERDMRLLKQKIDLLIDGYQVLYMKLDQQNRILQRLEEALDTQVKPQASEQDVAEDRKVVRMSERFLGRVRNSAEAAGLFDPDDKTLA
jgi:hypothetical protein